MKTAHQQRIKNELKASGVTSYGLLKAESRSLHQFIHEDEHIKGVVYGQSEGSSVMLVATDRRVIFLDQKPFFSTADEISYDMVSGIKVSLAALSSALTLHTRMGDYSVHFANAKGVKMFRNYIESRRIESQVGDNISSSPPTTPISGTNPTGEALKFLQFHDTAILSTQDRTGNLNGAVIHYTLDEDNLIYILTKSGTAKGRNIFSHGQVALTIFEKEKLQTLQLRGFAEVETRQDIKDAVFTKMIQPRKYGEKLTSPPVTKLHDGAFIIIKITSLSSKFRDYTKGS